MTRVILASKSPRRKQLMEELNIPFEIIVADIDESIDETNTLTSEIENLSYRKAEAVFKNNNDALVIGSDTIVVIDGKVLGKPKDEKMAHEMLKMLQGNKHQVITGVTLLSKDAKDSFSVVSDVYFNEMSDEEIDEYIKTKEPMDKAGSYGIQGHGSKFIKKIDGDFYAVMGFPISEVYRRIKKYI